MAESGPLGIVLFDGGHERVHYALSLAAAALALDRPVAILIAGPAVEALTEAGWGVLRDPEGIAQSQARAGVADIETLWRACRDLGARITVCEAALATRTLTPERLREALPVGGLVGFLADCPPGSAILFV